MCVSCLQVTRRLWYVLRFTETIFVFKNVFTHAHTQREGEFRVLAKHIDRLDTTTDACGDGNVSQRVRGTCFITACASLSMFLSWIRRLSHTLSAVATLRSISDDKGMAAIDAVLQSLPEARSTVHSRLEDLCRDVTRCARSCYGAGKAVRRQRPPAAENRGVWLTRLACACCAPRGNRWKRWTWRRRLRLLQSAMSGEAPAPAAVPKIKKRRPANLRKKAEVKNLDVGVDEGLSKSVADVLAETREEQLFRQRRPGISHASLKTGKKLSKEAEIAVRGRLLADRASCY